MFAIPHLHFSKSALLGLSALVAIAAVPATQAQTQITYDAQVPFSFSSPTLDNPRGIAVASDGTVYLADVESGTTGRVVQITPPTPAAVTGTARGAASLAATVVTLAPSITIKRPTAVTLDSTGALYIADGTNGVVIKMAAPETSSAATLITYPGTETPTALATDSSNNLYIADETRDAIYEAKAAGGTPTKLNLSSTVLKPVGLTVDSSGNVYFADAHNNEVYKYTASTTSTAVYLTTSSAGNFQFSATTAYPIGMGFDSAGSLYILDNDTGNLTQVISPATSTANVQLPLSSSLTPAGLAVSSIGNLYVSDDAADTADEIFYNNNPFNYGSIAADYNGSNALASPAVTVNFQFNTKAQGVAIYQSMQGDVSTEFHTRSDTCSGNLNSTCSMAFYVEYSSSLPGTRNGVVGLTDNAGDLLAVPNTGIDLAGAMALYPGTQATLPQTSRILYEPQGMAVTGDGGTLFISDEGGVRTGSSYTYTNGAVLAYKATGGTPGATPTTIGSFRTPTAVALDAEGNLYVADYSGTVTVVPVSYNSTTGNTWPGFGTPLSLTGTVALNHPMALAFDASGNLYIGDMGPGGIDASASNPGYIIKVPANGGPATRLNYTVGGIPIVFPQALAIDSEGNLYIADGGDGDTDQGGVDVVPVATGTASAISFGSFGPLNQPSGLGFDAANDLYVLDGYNQRVLVVPVTYTGTGTVPAFGTVAISLLGQGNSGLTSVLTTPSNLVVWPGGQYITVSDLGYQSSSGTVDPVQVLTLQAVNTTITATSGTASVTGVNVGSQEITFAAPTNTNPAGISFTGCGSSSGTTLATGVAADCSPTVAFEGAGGATITLNGNTADDYSALGNQIIVPAPIASLTSPTVSFSSSVTATLSNTGTGNLVISNIQASDRATLAGGGTCAIGGSVPAGGSCTINFTITQSLSTGTITVTDNSGNVPGSTQSTSTFLVVSIGLTVPGVGGGRQFNPLLPTDDIPRNLLDPNTANTADISNDANRPIDNLSPGNRDKKKGGKKLHR